MDGDKNVRVAFAKHHTTPYRDVEKYTKTTVYRQTLLLVIGVIIVMPSPMDGGTLGGTL